ncbi:MAG: acyl-CoA carboxylase subunit beta [Planctomycetes bacterium]|nr:acyl-CoA carboxylase subunit beta [Planctomycetota bacterium]MCL4729607.1 acyl-CoA carboxylase subunit beta [Planctomycetota bacterium]
MTAPAAPIEIPSSRLATQINAARKQAPAWLENVVAHNKLIEEHRKTSEKLRLGGGAKAIAKKETGGQLPPRKRVEALLDKGPGFLEYGLYGGLGMYDEWGIPSANVITGVGTVRGRQVMVVANDSTIKAGAFCPMTSKKVLRAQRVAMENKLPLVYLVDSAGVFLPLQDEVFPDKDDFGKVFDYAARISALGIPQIAAVMGLCVAGGAYLPVMCDHVLMTEGSGMYLAAAALARAAKTTAADISNEEIGGARVHAEKSGTADYVLKDDAACIEKIRELVGLMAHRPKAPFDRVEARPPAYDAAELKGLVSPSGAGGYEMREVIARLVDDSAFHEYKPDYGKTLVCGYARMGGFAVGIVANQKETIRNKDKPWETGGVIYHDAADKAARFIMDCNQLKVPLVFLHDVNGFMVGPESEHNGIIRKGAKMVNAMANSVVPKISIIIGGSFGAGHYAMCGRAYRPRYIAAWPCARYAVMGGDAASNTLLTLQVAKMQAQGKEVTEAEKQALLADIKKRYTDAMAPAYGAARLWLDAIIEPTETREVVIQALEMAANNPEIGVYNTGVLQT